VFGRFGVLLPVGVLTSIVKADPSTETDAQRAEPAPHDVVDVASEGMEAQLPLVIEI
jgi:hypothetical protein